MIRRRSQKKNKRRVSKQGGEGGCLVVLILIGVVYFFFYRDGSDAPELLRYEEQIQALNDAEKAIGDLGVFISVQRQRLQEQQSRLSELEERNRSLQEFIETNQEKVDAVLEAYEARQQRKVWAERAISFLLGILASFVGQTVFSVLRKWKSQPPDPGKGDGG